MKFSKHSSDIPTEFAIPIAASILFLVSQAAGRFSELSLTAFIVAVSFLIFVLKEHRNEKYLFITGVLVGSFIEIGLRILGYQQTWTDASLFGVPYWLPIAWGLGFVVITRIGVHLRRAKIKD